MTKNPADWIIIIPIFLLLAAYLVLFFFLFAKNVKWLVATLKFRKKVASLYPDKLKLLMAPIPYRASHFAQLFKFNQAIFKNPLRFFREPESVEEFFGFPEIRKLNHPELNRDLDNLRSLWKTMMSFFLFLIPACFIIIVLLILLGMTGTWIQQHRV